MKKIVLVLSVFICMIMGLLSCKKERIDTSQSSIRSESAAKVIEKNRIDEEYGYLEGRWYEGGTFYSGDGQPMDDLEQFFLYIKYYKDISFNASKDMIVVKDFLGNQSFYYPIEKNLFIEYTETSYYDDLKNIHYSASEIKQYIRSGVALYVYSSDIIALGARDIGLHSGRTVNQLYFKKSDYRPKTTEELSWVRSGEGEIFYDEKEERRQLDSLMENIK